MKVLTFSRHFPKGQKAGSPTYFVEKIWNCFRQDDFSLPDSLIPWTENYVTLLSSNEYLESIKVTDIKHHTIRAGNRWKVGDMASLRVWSGRPYMSKQIEFAQVEVKNVWPIEIYVGNLILEIKVDEISQSLENKEALARNDGLELIDFVNWFKIRPKAKKGIAFTGQIITWSPSINYTP